MGLEPVKAPDFSLWLGGGLELLHLNGGLSRTCSKSWFRTGWQEGCAGSRSRPYRVPLPKSLNASLGVGVPTYCHPVAFSFGSLEGRDGSKQRHADMFAHLRPFFVEEVLLAHRPQGNVGSGLKANIGGFMLRRFSLLKWMISFVNQPTRIWTFELPAGVHRATAAGRCWPPCAERRPRAWGSLGLGLPQAQATICTTGRRLACRASCKAVSGFLSLSRGKQPRRHVLISGAFGVGKHVAADLIGRLFGLLNNQIVAGGWRGRTGGEVGQMQGREGAAVKSHGMTWLSL